MTDTIESLRARIAELEGALAWQPVKTAPKDESPFLAKMRKRDGSVIVCVAFFDEVWENFATMPGHWRIETLIAWRPLGGK